MNSTFEYIKAQQHCLQKASLNLKYKTNESYSIEVLSTDFVCLPIKNQPIKTTKGNYEFLKDIELADSGNCDQIHILIHFLQDQTL